MSNDIVIAFVDGFDVVEFDSVVAVEERGDHEIEVILSGQNEPVSYFRTKAEKFVEQYKEYLLVKQASLGLTIERE